MADSQASGYTRGEWFKSLLGGIGNHNPMNEVIDWGIAWTQQETEGPPKPFAAYNLLNTTEKFTPGVVSDFNPVGVRNFDTYEHGIQANAKVLQNGDYPHLLEALKLNELSRLMATSPEINSELKTWGTGEVQSKIATIAAHGPLERTQIFPGAGPAPVPEPIPTSEPVPDTSTLAGIEKQISGIQSNLNAALKMMGLLKKAVEKALEGNNA